MTDHEPVQTPAPPLEDMDDPASTPTVAVSTTTTTGLKSPYRIWGKNLELLSHLTATGGYTIREISNKTLIPEKIVRIYCMRNLKRGLIESSLYSGFLGFRLTPLGLIMLQYNNNNNNKITQQIDNKYTTNRQQIGNKWVTNRQQIDNKYTTQTKLSEQLDGWFSRWKGENTEPVVVVVDTLIGHWKGTGSKFLYSHDFETEKLQIPPTEFKDAIAKLKRDGVIYTYVDKHLQKLKIGLLDAFLKKVELV